MRAIVLLVVLLAAAVDGRNSYGVPTVEPLTTRTTVELEDSPRHIPTAPSVRRSTTLPTTAAPLKGPRLEFAVEPRLFQPLRLRLDGVQESGGDPVLYVELQTRALDVLPGHEESDWRPIATKSVDLRHDPPDEALAFGCEWIGATGLYRVQTVVNHNNQTLSTPTVRLERPPATRGADGPRLRLRDDSIFPHCDHDFDLAWQLPNCTIGRQSDEFRVRVSAVQPDGMELYVGEFRATPEPPRAVGIPCAQFDIIYEQFCFELVSVHPLSHQLDLWDRRCVNTEPVVRIDGGWTAWSEWSPCSRTCGKGRRKRRRECTNPKPQRGRYCEGAMVDSESCNSGSCATRPPPHTSPVSDCECGCTLGAKSGSIFASRSAACANRSLEWTVKGHYLAKLKLVFVEKLAEDELMRVIGADGQTTFWLNGHTKPSPSVLLLPLDSTVKIVLSSTKEQPSGEKRTRSGRTGVYIDYEIIPQPQPTSDGTEYSALIGSRFVACQSKKCHAMMTILSLLVCLGVIVFLVAVPPLVCSFFARRRLQSKMRKQPLLASIRNDSEMMRSGGTDSTQVSSNGAAANGKPPLPPDRSAAANGHANGHALPYATVAKRSIGVQRSAQSTPRQLRSALETPAPNASIASVDLEYDYYEPCVVGSFLHPAYDIDIDQIVAQETSGWLEEPRPTVDRV
ncbi:hypothetical protein M3Y99_00417700 [Aphelenchoides fujianensis]|nr:hypothetical protein M3Y99_00417700 [Aphelenchoides fujianensis]